MVPINTNSVVLSKIHAKQKWLLKVLTHDEYVFKLIVINPQHNFYYSFRHNLYCPLVLLITTSLPSVLCFDIWVYNGKEMHEQDAPVLNNGVTGLVLNNFTLM